MRFIQKAVILHPTDNGRFLIIRRHDADHVRPGTWDLPGGSVLYGEEHGSALMREIFEETAIAVTDVHPVFVSTKLDTAKNMYLLLIAFVCSTTSANVVLSGEHTQFMWSTAKQFVDLDPEYDYISERVLDITKSDLLRDIVTAASIKGMLL